MERRPLCSCFLGHENLPLSPFIACYFLFCFIIMSEPMYRSDDSSSSKTRSKRSEGTTAQVASKSAVHKEGDFKMSLEKEGPVISMTVVGDKVEFTQNFNF
ncbi:hypothetical protein [Leek white stripe virus]|uniref:ORF 3 protein n=1 Tax=Leek white stripe virus TaxID=45224 RepID=Q83104_9TOMB|nr:hypothetical protein [Leek white stripe virus]CAA64249.1 ORF 3 [Leek white stripe virus]